MDIALVTTTIHKPEVLRQYRDLDPDACFIIAGDRKTPHAELEEFCEELGNALYLSPRDQGRKWPRLSRATGWDCVQRRNFAVLQAAEWKPDVIVTIDTDNAPMGDYFTDLESSFGREQNVLSAADGWFNLGEHGRERFRYRGLPYGIPSSGRTEIDGDHQIGVVNGLIFGDPDINATERIERNPQVSQYSPEALEGIVVDPANTWTSVNSQNTAYRAELAPLMLVLPRVGRYDDIWGSYLMQSVLAPTDWSILFGRPWVRQDRHEHDLITDLEAEMLGMRHTERLTGRLEGLDLPEASVVENLGRVCEALEDFEQLPHDFLAEWVEAWS